MIVTVVVLIRPLLLVDTQIWDFREHKFAAGASTDASLDT